MGENFSSIIKNILIILYIGFFIAINSIYQIDGGLDLAGKNLLRTALNIVENNNIFINDLYSTSQKNYATYWLYGYAYIIASAYKYLIQDIYIASKISNFILIACLSLFIYFSKKSQAYLYNAILLFLPILSLLYFSNDLFLLTILTFFIIISIDNIYHTDQKINFLYLVILTIASLFASYSGFFIAIYLLILGIIYLFKKNKLYSLFFISLSLVNIAIIYYIINNNYNHTDMFFGKKVKFSWDNFIELKNIINPLLDYLIIIFGSFFLAYIFTKVKSIKLFNNNITNIDYNFIKIILLAGDLYLIGILILLGFGIIDITLYTLTPLFIIWSYALIYFIINLINIKYLSKICLLIIFISTIVQWGYIFPQNKGKFFEYKNELIKDIDGLDYNSLVMFTDDHLIYLSNNLQVMTSYPFKANNNIIEHIEEDQTLSKYLDDQCMLSFATSIYLDKKLFEKNKIILKNKYPNFILEIEDNFNILYSKDENRFLLLKQCVYPLSSV